MSVSRGDAPDEIDVDIDDVEPYPRFHERRLWEQERIRGRIALALTVILALTILGAFIGALPSGWANVKDLLQLVLPAETALLGGALGFYFGSSRRQ